MSDEPMMYWRFAMRLKSNNEARLRWSYLSPRRRSRGHLEGKDLDHVRVDLMEGSKDRRLASHRVPVLPTYARSGDSRVSGDVPFHPDATHLRIFHQEVLVAEVVVAREKPRVEFASRRVDAKGTLEWRAQTAETGQRWFSVFLELDSGKRVPLASKITQTRLHLDADDLPGCRKGRLIVRVSDGVWTAEDAMEPLVIPAKDPRAWILAPRRDSLVHAGMPLSVLGQGWDVQEQQPIVGKALQWHLDGEAVGQGKAVLLEDVAAGEHELVLTVLDSAGRESRRTLSFAAR